MATPFQLTFDCADADVMAAFWGAALGYVKQPPPGDFATWEDALEANGIPVPPAGSYSAIIDPDGVGPRVFFQRVPEPKTAKNRLHLDVRHGPGREARADELVAIGAELVEAKDERGEQWLVLRDPEGNEFCLT